MYNFASTWLNKPKPTCVTDSGKLSILLANGCDVVQIQTPRCQQWIIHHVIVLQIPANRRKYFVVVMFLVIRRTETDYIKGKSSIKLSYFYLAVGPTAEVVGLSPSKYEYEFPPYMLLTTV